MSNLFKLFEKWHDIVELQAGELIIAEESVVSDLYVILSGEVELSLRGKPLGKESAGNIIGEMAILPSAGGNPTVRAISEVRLARLDQKQFNRLLAENPAFSKQAMLSMANRLRAANAFISSQLEDRE